MSARIEAAVGRMRIRPADAVLEIGCGHGIAVDLICRRLRSGKVVAIDRSPKMIAAATRRNSEHIASGRAELHVADLQEFEPQGRRFDLIVALRVGVFHREPKKAREIVKRWLKPGGRLVAEYDKP
jgi:Methylase involved in ubiquinone/menaquinone biosynthesis